VLIGLWWSVTVTQELKPPRLLHIDKGMVRDHQELSTPRALMSSLHWSPWFVFISVYFKARSIWCHIKYKITVRELSAYTYLSHLCVVHVSYA
jgi:hypothetical protein